MNGITMAHRELGDRIQTVMGTITGASSAQTVGRGFINFYNQYLESVKPSTIVTTTTFTMDTITVLPSSDTSKTVSLPLEIIFTVSVEDTLTNMADTMILHATVPSGGDYTSAYTAMDTAFKAAQPTGTSIDLNDPTVFVDSIIVKV